MRFFYNVTLQAYTSCPAPLTVEGLCVFDKRAILFGSEGSAKIFSSDTVIDELDVPGRMRTNLPTAVVEAVEAGIGLIVVITEGIPVADSAYFVELALQRGVRIIGPNCPGLLTLPSQENEHGVNLGIIPDGIVGRGPIGLVSKSGTLTYQLMGELSDIGFTACLGVGGDPIVGTTLLEALQEFEQDADTKAVVMIGEIGGSAEQDAAAWAAEHMTKPVVAYIAGFTAPEGKQMGHAGAIVSGGKGTAQDKKSALEAAGIPVGRTPGQTADLMRKVLAERSLV